MSKESKVIYSSFSYTIWVSLIFSLLFLILGVVFWEKAYHLVFVEKTYLALGILVFPFAGIFGVYKAVKHLLIKWRLGKMPLVLDPLPGSIGGDIGGLITCKSLVNEPVELVLSCMDSEQNSESSFDSPLWQRNGYARTEGVSEGARLSFCFKDIPSDLPSTTSKAEKNQARQKHRNNQRLTNYSFYYWMLEVKLPRSICPWSISYKIPVRNEQALSSSIDFDSSNLPEFEEQRGIRSFLPFIDENTYQYGYFCSGFMSWSMVLFGLAGIAFGAFVGFQAGNQSGFDSGMMYLMALVSIGLSSVFFFSGLTELLSKTTVILRENNFIFKQTLFGFQRKHWDVSYRDIQDITAKKNGSSSTQRGGMQQFYHIVAKIKVKEKTKKITLAYNLNNSMQADDVLSFFDEKTSQHQMFNELT